VRTTSSVRIKNAINPTTSKPVMLTPLDTDERTGEGFRPAIVTLHGLLGHKNESNAICRNVITIYQSTRYNILGHLSLRLRLASSSLRLTIIVHTPQTASCRASTIRSMTTKSSYGRITSKHHYPLQAKDVAFYEDNTQQIQMFMFQNGFSRS